MFTVNFLIKKVIKIKYVNTQSYLLKTNIVNDKFCVIASFFPAIFLFLIFIKALNNNFPYISKSMTNREVYCENGTKPKTIFLIVIVVFF